MPTYHLLDSKGELKRVYRDAFTEIREHGIVRLFADADHNYETVAIVALAPGDRLEHVNENR